MSIAPALLAIQLSTMTANGSFRGGGGGWIVKRWAKLSGWRSVLFGIGFAILCALVVITNMAVIGLTIVMSAWVASAAPVWLAIVGCISIIALGISICFGTITLLYR